MKPQTEIIQNRFHITSLLQRIVKCRAIVSIQPSKGTQHYNSAILDINPEQHCFLLDEPGSETPPFCADPGQWLRFHIKLNGLDIDFNAPIEEIIDDDGFPAYRVSFPQQLDYTQRRSLFRANVGYQFNAQLEIQNEHQRNIKGRILDISLSGLSAAIDVDHYHQLEKGTILPACQLSFPPNSSVRCEAIIRSLHIIPQQSTEMCRIGLELIKLGRQQKRVLQRLIMKFDRENRKSVTHA